MREKQLFEYAVIRVVPRVEREEFLNVVIILYCAGSKFLRTLFTLDERRIRCFAPQLNIEELEEYLHNFERISLGLPESGPIGKLDMPSRFRWLTATRSTVVQTSPVHPGLCSDPGKMLKRLYEQLVL